MSFNVLVVHDYSILGELLLARLKQTRLGVTPVLVSDPARLEMSAIPEWVPAGTDLIVNALWLADPENAAQNATAVGGACSEVPRALSDIARERDIPLMQMSSSYVFDGRKQTAYITSNPGKPFTLLGSWQWETEQYLRANNPKHLILRTGWSLTRFIRKVLSGLDNPAAMQLPSKHVGQPVTSDDLARVIVAMILQLDCGAEVWGTYQYAGAEEISMYDLGLAIAEIGGWRKQLSIIDDNPDWAELEPENSQLGCLKIRNTFGIKQLPWRTGMLKEIERVQTQLSRKNEPTDNRIPRAIRS